MDEACCSIIIWLRGDRVEDRSLVTVPVPGAQWRPRRGCMGAKVEQVSYSGNINLALGQNELVNCSLISLLEKNSVVVLSVNVNRRCYWVREFSFKNIKF